MTTPRRSRSLSRSRGTSPPRWTAFTARRPSTRSSPSRRPTGCRSTGTVDKATAAALESDLATQGGAAEQQSVATTAAVQQTLSLAGFWTGPVDGEWTPALTEALKAFQTELGVKPTGTVDAATIAALERAIAEAGEPELDPTATPSDDQAEPDDTESPSPTD